MALGKLAEGEELGSNLLHVGQGTPSSSGGWGSWKARPWRPYGLHDPFSSKVSGHAGHLRGLTRP